RIAIFPNGRRASRIREEIKSAAPLEMVACPIAKDKTRIEIILKSSSRFRSCLVIIFKASITAKMINKDVNKEKKPKANRIRAREANAINEKVLVLPGL